MSIRILIADDHGIVRQGLHSLLEQERDMEVVGEAEDGRKALSLVRELGPDILVMDITMPNLNGVDATRRIVSEFPGAKIIALSIHSGRRFVADMLKAGASGYVVKECLAREVVRAIRIVAAGGKYLSPDATTAVVDDYVKPSVPIAGSAHEKLSGRECKVLQLLAEGKPMRQIALELNVSPKTIEANRHKIMEKLDIHTVAGLTKYAICEGLTLLEH